MLPVSSLKSSTKAESGVGSAGGVKRMRGVISPGMVVVSASRGSYCVVVVVVEVVVGPE